MRKMAAGFEFDGKRAAGVPGVSATGGQAQPDPDGGPGGSMYSCSALRDSAGEHREARDGGRGGEYAGGG